MPGVRNTPGKRSNVPTNVIQENYAKTPAFDPSTYRGTEEEIYNKQKTDKAVLEKISIKRKY
jgi:hypothetical protein